MEQLGPGIKGLGSGIEELLAPPTIRE